MTVTILCAVILCLLPQVSKHGAHRTRRKRLLANPRSQGNTHSLVVRYLPTIFGARSTQNEEMGEALLHQMAGLLRGGMPATQAWERLSIRTTAQGLPRHDDLTNALDPRPTADTRRQAQGVVVACKLAHELGIPLAALLIVVAGTVDDSQRSIAQRQSALAGPAATGRVLLWLPIIGVLIGVLLGAQPLSWLVQEPLGLICLITGVGLLLAGKKWSNVLMAQAVRAGTAP